MIPSSQNSSTRGLKVRTEKKVDAKKKKKAHPVFNGSTVFTLERRVKGKGGRKEVEKEGKRKTER